MRLTPRDSVTGRLRPGSPARGHLYVSPRQRTLGSVVPAKSVFPGATSSSMGVCASVILSGPGFAPNLRFWTPWSFEMTPRRHGGALRNPGGSSPRLWAQSAPLVEIDLNTALSPRAQGGMRRDENAPMLHLFPLTFGRFFGMMSCRSGCVACTRHSRDLGHSSLKPERDPNTALSPRAQGGMRCAVGPFGTRPEYRPEPAGTGRHAVRCWSVRLFPVEDLLQVDSGARTRHSLHLRDSPLEQRF